jgi:hypothetical protein
VTQCIETRGGQIMPLIALVEKDDVPALPGALPIALDDSTERLVARLRSALRIRTMHATVLRRARAAEPNKQIALPASLLADATVLCGPRRIVSALSVAIGERTGLIGAFSIETAARCLNARDIDRVVIGDGLGARAIALALTVLAEDPVSAISRWVCSTTAAARDERLPPGPRASRSSAAGGARFGVRPAASLRGPSQADAKSLERRRDRSQPPGCWRRTRSGVISIAQSRKPPRPAVPCRSHGSRSKGIDGRRANVDAARLLTRLMQHRFRLSGAGWVDSGSLHGDRSAERSRGCSPHRKRAAADHGLARTRPPNHPPTITLATFKPLII